MQQALRNRLTFGPLMLAAVVALLYVDQAIERWTAGWVRSPAPPNSHGLAGVGIFVLLMVVLPAATRELAGLFTAGKARPYRSIAAIGSGSLAVHALLTQFGWFQHIAASTMAFILVFVMILAALRCAVARQSQEAITHMAGTVLATLYLGGLAWFVVALRVKHSLDPNGFQGSAQAIVAIVFVVKGADIGAFAGGKILGKHKLIPWLSPGKTWEGLFFGVVAAALVGLGCAKFWPRQLNDLTTIEALMFGALIGAIGQAGDLLESLFKRDAEVKDSGHLIPGFGGILDVLDSPLLAAPFAYLFLSLV